MVCWYPIACPRTYEPGTTEPWGWADRGYCPRSNKIQERRSLAKNAKIPTIFAPEPLPPLLRLPGNIEQERKTTLKPTSSNLSLSRPKSLKCQHVIVDRSEAQYLIQRKHGLRESQHILILNKIAREKKREYLICFLRECLTKEIFF